MRAKSLNGTLCTAQPVQRLEHRGDVIMVTCLAEQTAAVFDTIWEFFRVPAFLILKGTQNSNGCGIKTGLN